MLGVMAENQTQQQAAPADGQDGEQESGGGWGGRVLDAVGVVAGVALVIMAADILSDGRLISRRLRRRAENTQDDQAADADTGDM